MCSLEAKAGRVDHAAVEQQDVPANRGSAPSSQGNIFEPRVDWLALRRQFTEHTLTRAAPWLSTGQLLAMRCFLRVVAEWLHVQVQTVLRWRSRDTEQLRGESSFGARKNVPHAVLAVADFTGGGVALQAGYQPPQEMHAA